MEAVIIGAGPAGLTAGYALSKAARSATILEADLQVGGISRTVCHRGYRFDLGGHRFFSKSPVVNRIWEEVLGDDLLLRTRLSRIYYAGHFLHYPLRVANALAGLGPATALKVAASYLRARLAPVRPETSFEQWVSNRFGRELYEIFFKSYTEKVWGMPCAEIPAEWAAQRIRNLSLGEAVRRALFGNRTGRNGKVITSLIGQFHYPRLGPGMFWERCESLLAEAGIQTLRGMRVDEIRHDGRRVRAVRATDQEGRTRAFPASHCISSMPLDQLVNALRPAPPREVLAAADGLRYRDFLTVVLVADRDEVFPDNWIYIHCPSIRMARIQNYKNWSPDMVPDPSKTSLGLEYILSKRGELWSRSDHEIIDLGIRECQMLGLIEAGEVEDAVVVRMERAYPVYDRHHARNVAVIRSYLEQIQGLQTVGRNGLHRYNNMDHSMLTGIYAVGNAVGEYHDVWSVNVDDAYHEEADAASARSTQPGACRAQSLDELLGASITRSGPPVPGRSVPERA